MSCMTRSLSRRTLRMKRMKFSKWRMTENSCGLIHEHTCPHFWVCWHTHTHFSVQSVTHMGRHVYLCLLLYICTHRHTHTSSSTALMTRIAPTIACIPTAFIPLPMSTSASTTSLTLLSTLFLSQSHSLSDRQSLSVSLTPGTNSIRSVVQENGTHKFPASLSHTRYGCFQ